MWYLHYKLIEKFLYQFFYIKNYKQLSVYV